LIIQRNSSLSNQIHFNEMYLMTTQNPKNREKFHNSVKSAPSYRDYLARNYADAEGALNCIILSDNTVIGLTGKHSANYERLFQKTKTADNSNATDLPDRVLAGIHNDEEFNINNLAEIRVPEDNIWPFC